ncbi:hypothetical protein PR202_gb10723 [Eleusine coracana subsp. coracana]|uniref:Uncharacterized protein n=1 Tax=Eleusine coracana subsp. coracana TaxID=191504 RepID=A0AAV5EK89_ELECO|nr:hypothetical protein PR202_gb10723 [Eleusine coracana subsp. coracana]
MIVLVDALMSLMEAYAPARCVIFTLRGTLMGSSSSADNPSKHRSDLQTHGPFGDCMDGTVEVVTSVMERASEYDIFFLGG